MSSVTDRDSDIALVARAVLRLARRMRVEAPAGDLSGSALGLLATLYRVGPMSGVALAAEEGLKPQSLTRLVAGLEASGLIDREPDPADRRNLLISITVKGRRALEGAMRQRRAWLAATLEERLSPEERDTLVAAAALMLRIAA